MRILIVEKRDVVRRGIAGFFLTDPHLCVEEVARWPDEQASHRFSAIDLIIANQCIIPDMRHLPDGHFVILASEVNIFLLEQAYQQGALAYLLDTAPAALWYSVIDLFPGQFLLDPALAARELEQCFRLHHTFTGMQKLTAREQEIFHLVSAGIPNKAIASQLRISETTVKTHIARIYQKCGIRGRVSKFLPGFKNQGEGTEHTT